MSRKLNLRSVALRKRLKNRRYVIRRADYINHPDAGVPGKCIIIKRGPKRPAWERLGFRATVHD